MPRGVKTSNTKKSDLVKKLCEKIGCNFDSVVYNDDNGTIAKELLQEVCNYLKYSDYNCLTKKESAEKICSHLKLSCTNIDFNKGDDTISAGFIEKILLNLQ